MSPTREEPVSKSSAAEKPPASTESTPVRIRYYAQLREDAGRSRETRVTESETIGELFAELDAHYDFSVAADDLRVAVNDSFADWETSLSPDDLVVFIPPVAGG